VNPEVLNLGGSITFLQAPFRREGLRAVGAKLLGAKFAVLTKHLMHVAGVGLEGPRLQVLVTPVCEP
jgi:hypothetical protein